ncbi:MAG TPA: hypothetical protein VF078_06790 [Nitrospira sp.]
MHGSSLYLSCAVMREKHAEAERPSIERGLWPPAQAGQIRVFAFLRRPIDLDGLSLCTALFFVSLFLQARFLALPL